MHSSPQNDDLALSLFVFCRHVNALVSCDQAARTYPISRTPNAGRVPARPPPHMPAPVGDASQAYGLVTLTRHRRNRAFRRHSIHGQQCSRDRSSVPASGAAPMIVGGPLASRHPKPPLWGPGHTETAGRRRRRAKDDVVTLARQSLRQSARHSAVNPFAM